ncbi:hypothetical protein LCGC14_0622850 [marine sediment metagenome]|uniref:MYM-type domain-containing protein n=1 Tax=marine sediment metagenome TaxID=412755 RepID=A0A0F9R9F8_9ZZZZ
MVIQKSIIVCDNCDEQAFAEGNCPNDIIQSTKFIQGKNETSWYCSEECRNEHEEDEGEE